MSDKTRLDSSTSNAVGVTLGAAGATVDANGVSPDKLMQEYHEVYIYTVCHEQCYWC
jgi:hypothetical protein